MEVAGNEFKTFTVDHHGIIAALCKDLKLQEKIDERLHSRDPRRIVSPGHAVESMILNGLGFSNRRLYLTPQFFENKPVDLLISPDITAKNIDDHTLGKTLDEIADYGVTKFFGEIAFSIATQYQLLGKSVHNDSTSFSLSGAYEGTGEKIIQVTYGYSKDHQSHQKQVIMNLVTTGKSSIPLWMHPRSGNETDCKTLQDTMERVKKFQEEFQIEEDFHWIMDAAWYNKENLQQTGEGLWISRVPEKIKDTEPMMESDEETIEWKVAQEGYKTWSQTAYYGGVTQRWILVSSEQAYHREKKTFLKQIEKKRENLKKELKKLKNELFQCREDAQKELKEREKKESYFIVSGEIYEVRKHTRRGRPEEKVEPPIIGYKIEANFVDDAESIEKKLRTKGRFILATNDLDSHDFTDAQVLEEYKDQQQVERGFRFLKDPWFMVDSFFLKSERRIAALMAVMALCLMVYNIGQYRLRKALQDTHQSLPNQLNKPIKNPTLRWIFQIMEGIHVARYYDSSHQLIKEMISNLNDLRKQIITLFGKTSKLIYGIP